ncbi:hypothetical protein SELMODRAFT_404118 [Selaginella moellendorffii]|uniref:BUB1 N-terminal domain-containing protein n=1 Tax=Selaginella moellendorffii TaxID=88036 RepID=D8QUC0_SELML|nr:mitotic spindle checkpoint protein BUBR1 [Selaginella moellendorffii]EFJ35846.1 hypothetical protein SELMODRAFT_404118 [Selaginella moellendorffii]|eukprot:XP_002962383.1 mitotic spindle checkpoint protein BUBR1 [Selaginella moellendorffii]
MEWELSKENVQPLRKGRKNVDLLNQGLKAKHKSPARSVLIEQRRILLEKIDDYVGDDPLEPWIRCIEWTKEAFPSGGSQSGILPMLELCLRTFCDDSKYKSDLRYLKLWLDYADRCTHPRDIYVFLEVNDIGQTYAQFYEAYASYLERCKNLSKANEVFQIGIARAAEPVEELKIKYKSFLERTLRKPKPDAEEDTVDEGLARSFGSLVLPQSGQRTGSMPSRPPQKPSKGNAPPLSKQTFSVFVDSELNPASKVPGLHENGAQGHALPVWTNLGSQAERTKENVQQPTRWNEAKIPQRPSRPVSVSTEALDVYVDEEFTSVASRSWNRRISTAALKVRLSRGQDIKIDTEMLKQAPLRNFSRELR